MPLSLRTLASTIQSFALVKEYGFTEKPKTIQLGQPCHADEKGQPEEQSSQDKKKMVEFAKSLHEFMYIHTHRRGIN